MSAVQEGIGSTLVKSLDQNEFEQQRCLQQCVKRLTDSYIAEEGATFAVKTLAQAIGIPVEHIMPEQSDAASNGTKKLEILRNSKSTPKSGSSTNSKAFEDTLSDGITETNTVKPSNTKENPKKKKKSKLWILLLLLAFGVGAGALLLRGGEEVPNNVLIPTVLPSEEEEELQPEDALAVVPPVIEKEADASQAAAVVSEDTTPEEIIYAYQIDTVASNLYNFHAMVMDNQNNNYYINNGIVSCTGMDSTLNMTEDLGFDGMMSVYLAHDQKRDIVYLAGNTDKQESVIYNITNLNAPEIVLNQENCPALIESSCGNFTVSMTSYLPQVTVLENGALLLPFSGKNTSNGIFMVNIDEKTITPINYLTAAIYYKIIGEEVLAFTSDSDSMDRFKMGTRSREYVQLEKEAPSHLASLYSKYDMVYGYWDDAGVCGYKIDGSISTIIPKESIGVKDYQSIDTTDIAYLVVGDKDNIAFYDESLGCIRQIQSVIQGN